MADTLNSIVDRSISEFEDDKIKRVGKNAFRGCGDLSSVTLPNVRVIGDKAFKDCTSLEDISVGDNYDGVVSVNDDSFDGCNPVNVLVPKDKVDLYKNSDSWSRFVEKGLTVNWGKCGGTKDVVVTYKEGDPVTIPLAFLKEGWTNSELTIVAQPKTERYTSGIGYLYSYSNDGGTNNYMVYRLPQNIGKWLYDSAESATGPMNPFGGTTYRPFYKGIGTYSDGVLDTTADMGSWGIGIRISSDLNIRDKYNWTGAETREVSVTNSSFVREGEYYLILQEFYNSFDQMGGCVRYHNSKGLEDVECKRWLDMTATPSQTNKGTKYTIPSELCTTPIEGKSGTQGSIYGMKDSIDVNWGTCGGTEDVIVTYKKGEGIWVPTEFFGSSSDTAPSSAPGVGFVGDFTIGSSSNYKVRVFKLPQNIGKYLYDNAEDNACGTYDYKKAAYTYSPEEQYNYKGIAIYPDTCSSWTYSYGWGVGIRKKSDIGVYGYSSYDVSTRVPRSYSFSSQSTYGLLDDTSYYLVAELTSTGTIAARNLYTWINNWALSTSHEKIWLRHYNTMTSIPSATNQGEKYTFDPLLKSLTLPLTVNWGKCGGEKDVIVNYNKEDSLWIPQEFLTQSYNPSTKALYGSSSSIYGDGSVGYYCYDTMENANGYPISVYVLPQGLGRWLYDNAEGKTDGGYYGLVASDYTRAFKGIAVYPDSITSSSGWNDSQGWGVGIRTGADINVCGYDSEGVPVKKTSSQGSSAYDNNTYYLVMQSSIDASKILNGALQGMISLFGDGKVYLRHWNTMTSKPNGTTVMGKKYDVPMSLPPDNAKPLGGRVFYIDPNDNGATYTFYDEDGNKVTGTTAGELASAKYYVKKGTSTADKVYVYYGQATATGQWGSSNLIGTQTGIGTGKSNTAAALASPYSGTFWTVLTEFRENSGFDDLYVPSKDEILQLGLSGILTSLPYGALSSSEYNKSSIYSLNSNRTSTSTTGKNTGYSPLTIRSF